MIEEKKRFKKSTLIVGVIVATWLCITLYLLRIFKIEQGWPAFLACLLFFERGGKKEHLKDIFGGALVGILLGLPLLYAINYLTPIIGVTLAILIVVFIIIFLLISLGDILPMFFNNSTFLYFTVALIYGNNQATLEWLAVLILGGLFYVGGLLILFKLFARAMET
ncbi:MAG: DUF1097 domain-containing protein [Spirochaetes bacterium]|nr:DUF1097 domain-containing protein [Spirochaetota bacterium]